MALAQENTRWQQAIELANRGQSSAAHELFRQLAIERPDDASVWRWLANLTTDSEQRVEHLQRALDLTPGDSSTRAELHDNLVRLGVSEAKAQRREVARRCFERAIEVRPENEIAFLWLIEVCDAIEQRVDALERLFELQPKDPSIRGALSRDLAQLGEKAERDGEIALAHNHFKRAHKLDLENVKAALFLAGQESEALGARLSMLEKVLEREPENERAKALWDRLARIAATDSSTLPVNCCPICRAPKEPVVMQCALCGAELSLFDVSRVLKAEGVDRARLASEIERLEELLENNSDWRVRKSLLIARLNMGHRLEAARETKKLLEAMPLTEPQRLEVEQVHLFLLRQGAGDEQEAASQSQELVLVVDDSATVRSLVGSVLEDGGYETAFASTGMEALAALRKQVPSLVLLDIGLPNMDGYQLCQLIRQNPATAEVPVVMLSARDGFFDQVRGRMVGCQDYITKPFDADDLLNRVDTLVGQEA